MFSLVLIVVWLPATVAQFDTSTCGQLKGCLFAPNGCNPNSNCQISFSYYQYNGALEMEIFGQQTGDGFKAVGFSNDNKMGDDTVVFCRQQNGRVTSGLGYNENNQKSNTIMNSAGIQTVRSSTATNGNIYCSLSQVLNPNVRNVKNLNNTYYILMSMGSVDAAGNLGYHNQNKYVMPRTDLRAYQRNPNGGVSIPGPIQMDQGGPVKTTVDKMKIAHGIFMTLSWGIFMATGIMFARHFRGHWPDTTFLGVKMWFNFHRTLNMIAIAGTIAGFACIFVADDWRWKGPAPYKTGEENRAWPAVHSMCGLLACVIAWAQPLNAVFRCHPEQKGRFIFNWLHRILGFGAFILALAAVMIACVHFNPMFSNRDAALGLWIAYVAVFGIAMIIQEILSFKTWWSSRQRVGAEIEMDKIGHVSQYRDDELIKIQRIQIVILLLFVVCAIGLTVPICILIGLKPNSV